MKQTYIAPVADILSVKMESHMLDLSFSKEQKPASQIVTVEDDDDLDPSSFNANAKSNVAANFWNEGGGWDKY